MGHHFLRVVSPRSWLASGITGDVVAALDGERWLPVHVDAWVRPVVVSRPRSCCQVFGGRPGFCSAGHGVAGTRRLVRNT